MFRHGKWMIGVIAMFMCLSHLIAEDKEPALSYKCVTHEGEVYVSIGDLWLSIDTLQISGEGLMVFMDDAWVTLEEAIETGSDWWASWNCKKCGRRSIDKVNRCPYCGQSRY